MPQMMPLMWSLMLILMISMLLIMTSFIYFTNLPSSILNLKPMNNNDKKIWNWKW